MQLNGSGKLSFNSQKLKCEQCGKTLLLIEYGKIEIKCPRCGHISRIEIKVMSSAATR